MLEIDREPEFHHVIRIDEYSGRGAHRASFAGTTLWFSYGDVVAFRVGIGKVRVSENVWDKAHRQHGTAMHLNKIDGGTPEAKAARMPREAFERAAKRIVVTYRPTD